MNDKIEITVCMGSSCFARGNQQNLEFIEDFIAKNNIETIVELSGSRCEKKCAEGPNIIINGVEYNKVDEVKIKKILEKIIKSN